MEELKKPLTIKELQNLNLDKGELLELAGLDERGIDYAMPQDWLDFFVAELGERFGFTYRDMIYCTFWEYRSSSRGGPLSFCKEVDDALKKAGFVGFEDTVKLIKLKETKV